MLSGKEHATIEENSVVQNYQESSFDQNEKRVFPDDGFVPEFIDLFAKQIGQLLKRQSDKDLPRVYFSQGITCLRDSKNKMSAHEMQGVLIILLLILCSTCGADLDETRNLPKIVGWVRQEPLNGSN